MKTSFRLKTSCDVVFDYLTNMQKFVSAHPVIFQIDSKGDESYLVHETLRLGYIPFSFTYPVKIEKDVLRRTVIIRAVVFKLTKIEMKFALRAENGHTVIEEEINFRSPLPVKFIMQGIFKKQHAQLFKNIEMKENRVQPLTSEG
jgi:carbon monoxide dehydrogenase subunit G